MAGQGLKRILHPDTPLIFPFQSDVPWVELVQILHPQPKRENMGERQNNKRFDGHDTACRAYRRKDLGAGPERVTVLGDGEYAGNRKWRTSKNGYPT